MIPAAKVTAIRSIMRSSGLEEETDYGTKAPEGDAASLTFTDREGGNGSDCVPDPALIRHAREMGRTLIAKVEGIKCYVDTCDEWVSLIVRAA